MPLRVESIYSDIYIDVPIFDSRRYRIATPFGGLATPPGTYLVSTSTKEREERVYLQRHTTKEK